LRVSHICGGLYAKLFSFHRSLFVGLSFGSWTYRYKITICYEI
jgi:hypothetical protein